MEKFEALHLEIDRDLCEQSLEGLRKRKMVSYGKTKNSRKEVVRTWSVRGVRWWDSIEVAQVDKLLPALIETAEAKALIDALNDSEKKGDGTSKSESNDKMKYRDYVFVRLFFRTIEWMIGSQPSSPMLDDLVSRFPHGPHGEPVDLKQAKAKKAKKAKNGKEEEEKEEKVEAEAELRFSRNPVTGEIQIGSDAVAGWLSNSLRLSDKVPETLEAYLVCDAINFTPAVPLRQSVFPIVTKNRGAGLGSYETVEAGQEFSLVVGIPTKGYMSMLEFIAHVAAYVPRPLRGISPARGKRFGKAELVDFGVIGPWKEQGAMLESVEGLLTDQGKACLERIKNSLVAGKILDR
jgi:hypothetical protein